MFVDLSIIVPAYNEEHRLLPTLDKLHAFLQTQPLRYEIVVVDDGSRDGTAARRRAHGGVDARTCASCARRRTAARALRSGSACSRRAARSA